MNNRSHPGSPNQTSSTLFRNYVLFYLIFILNFIWSEQPPCGTILQGASKPLFSNEINIWWPLELCFRLTQLTFDIFSLPNCPKFYLYQFFRIIKLLFWAFFDTKSFDTNFVNVYFIISLRYLDFKILFEFISVSMIKFTNCFKQMTSI